MAATNDRKRPHAGTTGKVRALPHDPTSATSSDGSPPNRPPSWFFGLATVLLAVVVASNIYLLWLYLKVHSAPDPNAIDSFCNLGQTMNCVQVAASEYSQLFGVPLALYALEYYALALGVILLSRLSLWRIRRWDSLLFIMMVIALPISATMAMISMTKIQSFCLMCCAVYSINALLLLMMLVAYRGAWRDLFVSGPKELVAWIESGTAPMIWLMALIIFTASQTGWVPGMMQSAPTPAAAPVGDLEGIPQRGLEIGAANAPTLIEEFSDYECPHCSLSHKTLLQLVKRYPKKVRVRHHDFPLDQGCNRKVPQPAHLRACIAAYYARCAGKQGRYWDYAGLLFHNQRSLYDPDLKKYAEQLGLDVPALQACASDPKTRAAVANDIEEGIRQNVRGTPTFFINGKTRVTGPRPLSFWLEKLGIVETKAPAP